MNKITITQKKEDYFKKINCKCWLMFKNKEQTKKSFKEETLSISKNIRQLVVDECGGGCYVDLDVRDSPSATAYFDIEISVPEEKDIKQSTIQRLQEYLMHNEKFFAFVNESKKRKRGK